MLNEVDVFTVETVMSHHSKLDYIKLAKANGYKVYLYFVSTQDVSINIARVNQRVYMGGHDVPEKKIKSRYIKSLNNLYDALTISNRTYIFDNSEKDKPIWYAEFDGKQIIFNYETIPLWIIDSLRIRKK